MTFRLLMGLALMVVAATGAGSTFPFRLAPFDDDDPPDPVTTSVNKCPKVNKRRHFHFAHHEHRRLT